MNDHTDHAEKLHELPDESLTDILRIAKQIAVATGAENYNILQVWFLSPDGAVVDLPRSRQNNGRIAHQEVDHVHFHVIPKPSTSDTEGLVVGWPQQKVALDELAKIHEEIKGKL